MVLKYKLLQYELIIMQIIAITRTVIVSYLNITIPYSFLFTRKFRKYLFPEGVFICQKKHCVKSVQIRSFFRSVFSWIWTEYGDNNLPVNNDWQVIFQGSLNLRCIGNTFFNQLGPKNPHC